MTDCPQKDAIVDTNINSGINSGIDEKLEPLQSSDIVAAVDEYMVESSQSNALNQAEMLELAEYGINLYNTNKNMKDVADFMEHPFTQEFYSKHMKNWGDITGIVLLLKLYEKVSNVLEKKGIDLNGYQKIALVYRIMTTSKLRHAVCCEMEKWMRGSQLE